MYEGILGPTTRSFPPMFIVRIISKDGKELSDEEIDSIMENNNPMLRFQSVEEFEQFQNLEIDTDDKITFDFDSNGIIINYKKA
jgi:hypothetical protein